MRWKYLSLVLVMALAVTGIVTLVRNAAQEYGLRDLSAQSRERLKLISATLSTRIERFRYLPDVVARSRETEELFRATTSTEKRRDANHLLARIADASGASALYVIDERGMTIAASNYDTPGSFVGQEYSYRPYFRNALAKGLGSYYAVGATTGEPGYFLAVPIRLGERIAGVAVVKIDLLPVEGQWRDASEIVAMSDSQGIIFLSSQPGWRYRATGPLAAGGLERMREERRYGDAALGDAPFHIAERSGYDMATLGDDPSARRLRVSMPFGAEGWTLHYFADLSGVSRQADILALAAALAAMLVIAGIIIALQIRRGRIAARRAMNQLEGRVTERTQALRTTNDRLEREIAERQEAERELTVTRSTLSQAEKLAVIGQSFAGLAHEINQPLAALSTYISSTRLLLKRRKYEAIAENIDTMGEVVMRVSNLTDQLKRLARRDNDDFVELDLAAALRRSLNLLKFRFADLGITVTPAVDDALMVHGSPAQLDQVILNLLSNAIDAVRGREDPRIAVRGIVEGERCIVTVEDNGPGVDAEAGKRLFEPFHTTKAPGEGLGLGLATAHRIVSDHHGTLAYIRSDMGGACFSLVLGRAGAVAFAGEQRYRA